MGAIEKRQTNNGELRYRAKVRLKGFPTQVATFKRITDAKKWIQNTESAIRERRHFKTTEAKKRTFSELADRYLIDVMQRKSETQQKLQSAQLRWWKEQIGQYCLADITPALIVEKRDELARTNVKGGKNGKLRSAASVNRYLAILSHCLTVAEKELEWLENNPARKVSRLKEPRGRVRFLDDNERSRLLKTCKASSEHLLFPIVVVALSTGCRQGELLSLHWRQVDFENSAIRLLETKNDERRAVPLTGIALDLLKEASKVRRLDDHRVFPISADSLRKPWEKALKDAKVSDFRFHDLRHSAASYLAMNGATLSEIAEVLGHKTLAMVKRYAHLSEQHTSDVVSRMNKKIFGE